MGVPLSPSAHGLRGKDGQKYKREKGVKMTASAVQLFRKETDSQN